MLVTADGKGTFNRVAEKYDLYRPGYPAEMFDVLQRETALGSETSVLELGCGTGQLTRGLAASGAQIVGIDLSPDMAEVAKRNFNDNARVSIDCCSFEGFASEKSFDMVAAATSFHWLDKETRLARSHAFLKAGGFFAFVQNVGDNKDNALYLETEKIYQDVIPSAIRQRGTSLRQTTHAIAEEIAESGLFQVKGDFFFRHQQILTARDYLFYLDTLSFEHNLPRHIKKKLFDRTYEEVMRGGGSISLTYEAKMVIAQKKGGTCLKMKRGTA